MIQPVISLPYRSELKEKVLRLVRYCKELDGQDVLICEIPKELDEAFIATHPNNTFFSLQAFSLHREALMMKGEPFLHLEIDAIPLKSGWLKMISDEYARCGKPYLWAIDSHPPGDLCGGIGVYGSDTATEIPYELQSSGWDGWMFNNIPHKIAKTSLIQHKYGHYDGIFKVRSCRFPMDNHLIRNDAVLFHADPRQTLITGEGQRRFAHSGCIGDTIAALPAIRQLGGGHLVMTQKNNKRTLRGPRYEFLKPLVEAQPYITSVTWEEDPQDIDYDMTDFRTIYKGDVSLAQTQARYLGIHQLDESPWISVPPDPRSKGKLVIARSSRYQNYPFPWKQFARYHIANMIFIGLEDEHKALESRIGALIPSIVVKDALEVAGLIQGADAFIGNQSSPFWIAAGIGKKLVQEVYTPNPDSIINRENAFYWRDENHSKAAIEFIGRTKAYA